MRFKQAHIFGFGKWVDTTFDFTSSSFLTYFGENESGKSTLQQFLSFMLFGLPPRQRQFYQPKHSSRFGGSLTIASDKQDTFTIHRTAHEFICYMGEKEITDENWLEEVLEGLTRETFESIYSFSALDLSAIQQMKVEQLNQVLFSVGLTGSTNIYQLEKELETKIGQLYKPKGWKPALNEQLKVVQNKYAQLTKLKQEEAKYNEQKKLKQELETDLYNMSQELEKIKQTIQMKEKWLQVLPLRQQYRLLQKERNQYGDVQSFPEDGLNRLQQIKEHYLPLQSEQKLLQSQCDQYAIQVKQLQAEVYEDAIYQHLQDLVKDRVKLEQIKAEKDRLSKEVDRLDEAISHKSELIPLAPEEIKGVVLPFHLEKVAEDIQALDEEVTKETQWLQEETDHMQKEKERLYVQQEENEAKLADERKLQEAIEENRQYDMAARQMDLQEDHAFTVTQLYETIKKQGRIFALVASVITVVFTILAIWQADMVYIIIAGLAAVFGYWQYRQSNLPAQKLEMKTQASSLPIDKKQYMKNEQMIQAQEAVKTTLQWVENELKHHHYQQIQLDEKLHILQERKSQLKDRIETEQYQYPFLSKVEPRYWGRLIEIVRDMKRLFIEREKVVEQLSSLNEQYTPLARQLQQLAKDLVKDELTMEEVVSLYEKEKDKHQAIARYLEEKSNKEKGLQELKEKMAVYEAERDRLFRIARTDDEEQYYRIAYENDKRIELDEQLQQLKYRMEQNFHPDELTTFLQTETTSDDIERELETLQAEEIALSNDLASKNRNLATLEIEIEHLEQAGTVSDMQFTYEMEKNDLNDLAEQYAVLKVAQDVLHKAKENYQKKYFHRVIEQTASYFTYITNGKYINVYAPTEKELFQVEGKNNIRYTIEELSKGTIDQVYVSLRLAMNTVMQEKVKMPLMIDDAFVHFDEKRKERMIQLLKKISESQQVIFFTCIKDRVINGKVMIQEQLM